MSETIVMPIDVKFIPELLAVDGIFRSIVGGHTRIKPLTVMSIQELESLLLHMIRDGLTWPEILDRRFHGGTVWPISVHQALYEWSRGQNLPPSRNEFLLRAYESTFNESLALAIGDEPSADSPTPPPVPGA